MSKSTIHKNNFGIDWVYEYTNQITEIPFLCQGLMCIVMEIKKKETYFVCFIAGYFPALHFFAPYQNYYLYPLLIAEELGYKPVAIVKEGDQYLRNDPNITSGITIITYTTFFSFIKILTKYSLKNSVFYINNHLSVSYLALLYTRLFSRTSIFMGHIQPKRTTKIRQYIFECVMHATTRIRLNNISEKSFLLARGFSEKKLYIAPIAVNQEAFHKVVTDYTLRQDIVYYGNTTSQKGLPTIFEALAIVRKKIPTIKLHIVGSRGDYSPEKDVKDLGLTDNVVFHGPYAHGEQLNTLLNQFKVFVISTKGEGQCLAVYESALSGNALCLTNIMSFRDVFKNKALFHDIGDAEKLAENILYYLEHDDVVEEYNQRCLEMITKEYSPSQVKQQVVELLS
jgi:glycosyltransferase involved in cell wall biosynthesis